MLNFYRLPGDTEWQAPATGGSRAPGRLSSDRGRHGLHLPKTGLCQKQAGLPRGPLSAVPGVESGPGGQADPEPCCQRDRQASSVREHARGHPDSPAPGASLSEQVRHTFRFSVYHLASPSCIYKRGSLLDAMPNYCQPLVRRLGFVPTFL